VTATASMASRPEGSIRGTAEALQTQTRQAIDPRVPIAGVLVAFVGLGAWRFAAVGVFGLLGIAAASALAGWCAWSIVRWNAYQERETVRRLNSDNSYLGSRVGRTERAMEGAGLKLPQVASADLEVAAAQGSSPPGAGKEGQEGQEGQEGKEPLATMEFVSGIDRKGIEDLVDELLQDESVNVAWLPDEIEREVYIAVIGLVLGIFEEVIQSLTINLYGHTITCKVSHLASVGEDGEVITVDGLPRPQQRKGGTPGANLPRDADGNLIKPTADTPLKEAVAYYAAQAFDYILEVVNDYIVAKEAEDKALAEQGLPPSKSLRPQDVIDAIQARVGSAKDGFDKLKVLAAIKDLADRAQKEDGDKRKDGDKR